jgi:hypothetical protein
MSYSSICIILDVLAIVVKVIGVDKIVFVKGILSLKKQAILSKRTFLRRSKTTGKG